MKPVPTVGCSLIYHVMKLLRCMSTKPIIYKLILFSNWVKPKGVLELMLVYFFIASGKRASGEVWCLNFVFTKIYIYNMLNRIFKSYLFKT